MSYTIEDTLEYIYKLGYEDVGDSDTFIEIFGEDTDEIKELATMFNNNVRHISHEEVKKLGVPITMKVSGINPNNPYQVDLIKPSDVDLPEYAQNQSWTNVTNHTIFNRLQVGDEVLVGYYGNGHKSNCWIMFAKLNSKEAFEDRSIMSDINKIYDVNENSLLIRRLLEKIIPEVFPDNEEIDEDGNVTTIPNPMKIQFFNELNEKWKDVKNND